MKIRRAGIGGAKFHASMLIDLEQIISPPCAQVMGMLPEELRNGVAVSINSSLFARVALLQHIFDPLDRAQVLYKELDCFA